jgi:hypothetical protein
MDTGFATGTNANVDTAIAGGADGKDQVRKIAIKARMAITAPVPYFTSMMKPS